MTSQLQHPLILFQRVQTTQGISFPCPNQYRHVAHSCPPSLVDPELATTSWLALTMYNFPAINVTQDPLYVLCTAIDLVKPVLRVSLFGLRTEKNTAAHHSTQ